MALNAIKKAFHECNSEEAEKLYDAYVYCVIGKPSELIEINISDVEVAQSGENFFHIPHQYVAIRGAYIGSLFRLSKQSYRLDRRDV